MNKKARAVVSGVVVIFAAAAAFVAYQIATSRQSTEPMAAELPPPGGPETKKLPQPAAPMEMLRTDATGTYTVPATSKPAVPPPAAR